MFALQNLLVLFHLLHLFLGECLGQLDHLPLGDVAILVLVKQTECHLCLVALAWKRLSALPAPAIRTAGDKQG